VLVVHQPDEFPVFTRQDYLISRLEKFPLQEIPHVTIPVGYQDLEGFIHIIVLRVWQCFPCQAEEAQPPKNPVVGAVVFRVASIPRLERLFCPIRFEGAG
jgi:hypothetical protein